MLRMQVAHAKGKPEVKTAITGHDDFKSSWLKVRVRVANQGLPCLATCIILNRKEMVSDVFPLGLHPDAHVEQCRKGLAS